MDKASKWASAFCATLLIGTAPCIVAAEPCSLSTLRKIQENVSALSPAHVESFFGTLKKPCMGNVEFSEWSNELTFSILTNKPRDFFEVLDRQSEEALAIVIEMLESPIHDGIDLQKAYTAAKSTKTASKSKRRILESLQVAAGKYGATLE